MQIYQLIFYSNGQTQTNITTSNLQELDTTTFELCKLSDSVTKIQKDVILLQHSIAAQQSTLEFLNRHTAENLQTIVEAVQQLVHIIHNTQDNTQTIVQRTTKFQNTAQANSLMTLELIKRNSRRLPVIQETIHKTTSTLDQLIQEPQPAEIPEIVEEEEDDQMPHLEEYSPQDSSHQQQNYEEDTSSPNKTDIATPITPWDSLPYGRKMRSKEAFLQCKHKSLMR